METQNKPTFNPDVELPTYPPLVHFTTADLINIAKDEEDEHDIISKLRDAHAIVLITPEHLAEFVPAWERGYHADVHKRLELPDRLPQVAYIDWDASTFWEPKETSWPLPPVSSTELKEKFFDEATGQPQEEIIQHRYFERSMSEAEFFARGGLRSRLYREDDTYNPFDPKYLRKFNRKNGSHGSDIESWWIVANRISTALEAVAPRVGLAIPLVVKEAARRGGEWLRQKLDQLDPWIEAKHHGTTPDNIAFRLWYETKQELLRKRSEVGGLSERFDLDELRFWPLCSLITLDKEFAKAVNRALETVGLDAYHNITERFVPASKYDIISKRLEDLATRLPETADAP